MLMISEQLLLLWRVKRLILQIFTKLAEKLDPDTCRGLFVECVQWTTLIHWTFLQTMIVGLCVRNSSYEKKQIDQSLSLSLSDMFNHQICWLQDHLLVFFSNINSCRLMIKLINFRARCWISRRQVQKRVWRQHTFDTSTHTLKSAVMISDLKLRGEYVLHIDVTERSTTIEPDMR